MRLRTIVGRCVLPLAAAALCAATPVDLTDQDLLKYAQGTFDKSAMMFKHVELGTHHGARVVADFPCSDLCPNYTTRIIHYELKAGQTCASVDGVEQKLAVPVSIATTLRLFCVPKVVADAHLSRVG